MLSAAIEEAREAVEARILTSLDGIALPVARAMGYAVKGGKGLRGFLVLEGARINNAANNAALSVAAGIECIHAYSLVHDDLPCMDDDDLRRGQPTVHRKWDEATAVLAGDALQSLGFELVLQNDAPAEARVTLAHSLARAAGIRGMVGGQAMDIAAESAADPLSLTEVEVLQAGKTGALIEWASMAGAWIAGANPAPLGRYGKALGLAFQIWDDVLDVEGDAVRMGKAVRKDADAGKATFVSLLGLDEAKRRANELVTEACDTLMIYGEEADRLRALANYVVTRDR